MVILVDGTLSATNVVFFPGLLGLSDFLEKTGICEDTLVVVAETIGNEEVDLGCEAIFHCIFRKNAFKQGFNYEKHKFAPRWAPNCFG